MYRIVCILFLSLCWAPALALANCVTLTLTPWPEEQGQFLAHVAAQVGEPVTLRWLFGTTAELCAPTASMSGLDLEALQATAQGFLDAMQAAMDAQQATIAEARTEVRNNTFCNASLATIVTRVNAEQAAIQAAIDASTTLGDAKTALTTMNSRYGAALKFLTRCVAGRATLRGE